MSLSDAQGAFQDNLRRLTGADGVLSDPIAWNLNKGLLELTLAVQKLQSEMDIVQRELRSVQGDVRSIK